MADITHPPTAASWETRGYWEGADRGELVLQRCRECKTVQHRPRAISASAALRSGTFRMPKAMQQPSKESSS